MKKLQAQLVMKEDEIGWRICGVVIRGGGHLRRDFCGAILRRHFAVPGSDHHQNAQIY